MSRRRVADRTQSDPTRNIGAMRHVDRVVRRLEDTMDTPIKLGRAPSPEADAPIHHLKPPVDPSTLSHKLLLDGAFWHRIPAYRAVDEATFLDHQWQAKNTITNPQKLLFALQDLVPQDFYDDVAAGFHKAPMSIRVSPYLL